MFLRHLPVTANGAAATTVDIAAVLAAVAAICKKTLSMALADRTVFT